MNSTVPLGRVGERPLREIWDGPEIVALREALARADFSLGCQDCGVEYRTGDRLSTHAEAYDRYPEGVAAWPRRIEFALSNTCNLQCVHCNGELSSAIRSHREKRAPLAPRYDDRFFEEIADFLPHLEVAVFIGGEPFLARPVRRVWDMLIERDLHPEVHVTTNGTIWNEQVERYVRTLEMNVAVSVDGVTASTNDAVRQGSELAQVDATRRRLKEVTRSYGGAFIVNHCFLTENWWSSGPSSSMPTSAVIGSM